MQQTTRGVASTIVLCWLAVVGVGSEMKTPPIIKPGKGGYRRKLRAPSHVAVFLRCATSRTLHV